MDLDVLADLGITDSESAASVLSETRVSVGISIAAATILVYDTILTFPQEIKCIWSRKWSVVTLLYVALRYGTLLDNILSAAYSVMTPSHVVSCEAVSILNIVVLILVFTSISIFETLRVWLITGKNWRPAVAVFVLTVFTPCVDIYLNSLNTYTLLGSTYGPFAGCWLGGDNGFPYFGVICRSSNMIAAAMALYVTWRKTAFVYLRDQEIAKNTSLLALFLYNGVVLFAILLVLNIINVVIDTFTTTVVNATPNLSLIVSINEVLSTIIIGRFMLDLRYIHTPGDSPHSNTQGHQNGSHVTSIVFNVTLGNLGSVQQSRPSWLSGAGDDGQLEEEELAFSDEPLKAAALDLRPDNELELQEIGRRDDPDPSV